MAEPCDYVFDGGQGGDDIVHQFSNIASSAGLGSDTRRFVVGCVLAASGSGSDLASPDFFNSVAESGTGAGAVSPTAFSARLSVADRGRGIDSAVSRRGNDIQESGSGSSAAYSIFVTTLGEGGSSSDAIVNRLNSPTALAERGDGRVLLTSRYNASIAEAGSSSDLSRSAVFVWNVMGESGQGSSAAAHIVSLVGRVNERGSSSDAASSFGTMRNLLEEFSSGADIASQVVVDQSAGGEEPSYIGEDAAWVAGINRMPMARWSALPGQSVSFNDGLLVGGPDGLWREAAGDVSFEIDLGSSDFARPERKHLAYAYATGQISAGLDLVVQDHEEGNSEEWTYSFAPEDGEEHETIRVNLGRGHRSRYFNMKIEGSGQAQMTNLIVRYDLMSRRI